MPAATVVIATYERRELVRRAVESVLAQTRPDFELVVVDDSSTDGTAEHLVGLDPRLVVRRQPHVGVAAARNAGVRRGAAPVIAFLDSDDCWLPEHLATVLEMLERHPEAVLASTCRRFLVRSAAATRDAVVKDVFAESLLSNVTGLPTCIPVRRWDAYELREQEDRNGGSRLIVILSPRVADANEDDLITALIGRLPKQGPGASLAARFWRDSSAIQVRREHPSLTSAMKLRQG